MRLVLRVGSNFSLDPTLHHKSLTSPHLQKVLPCRHSCHTWDFGLETPCKEVSPMLSTARIARMNLKWLGTWDLETAWTFPKLASSNPMRTCRAPAAWVGALVTKGGIREYPVILTFSHIIIIEENCLSRELWRTSSELENDSNFKCFQDLTLPHSWSH